MKTFTHLLAAAVLVCCTSAQAATTLDEGFDDLVHLGGWTMLNNSSPPGQTWFQGNPGVFAAQAGTPDSYIAANFLGALNGMGTLDLWLLSPVLTFSEASTLSFYARSTADPGFQDQLEVRIGSGSDLGSYLSVLEPLTTVPGSWTQYTASVGASTNARLAFHYTGSAAQASYLGLDSISLQPVPEPATWVMFSAGLLALLGYRHRRALVTCGAVVVSSVVFAGAAPQPAPGGPARSAPPPVQASGLIAVRDARTGQLRAPTAAEAAALARLSAAMAQPPQAAAPQATVRRADGTLQRHLGEAGQTYTVITRGADGKLAFDCVHGSAAADAKLNQEEAHHADR